MRSLVILTLSWEGVDKLKQLFNSLLPALPEDNWKWFIRDNGSTDNTIETVLDFNHLRVFLNAYPNNLSNFSQGNNWLFQKANPDNDDYILLLNNDIVFQDTTSIKNMTDILDNDQRVGIVGAKLNYQDRPNIIQHKGVLFHPVSGMPYHFGAGKVEAEIDRKNRYYPILTGAVLLIRASLFREIGGLDERYNWAWEDSSACMMVQELGKKVVYCGETNILHSESATLKKTFTNKLFFQQNIKIFTDRWKSKMDKSLVKKYEQNPDYAIYK